MSKPIIFSTKYPSYHPQAGQPTNFVEKIWDSLLYNEFISLSKLCELSRGTGIGGYNMNNIRNIYFDPKHHTIRKGNRWKVGDKFSPRIWGNDVNPKSGRSGPYHSKQIIIAPDIEIRKVWEFIIIEGDYFIGTKQPSIKQLIEIAKNDGFSELDDFELWFNLKRGEEFRGQIICWNENINY